MSPAGPGMVRSVAETPGARIPKIQLVTGESGIDRLCRAMTCCSLLPATDAVFLVNHAHACTRRSNRAIRRSLQLSESRGCPRAQPSRAGRPPEVDARWGRALGILAFSSTWFYVEQSAVSMLTAMWFSLQENAIYSRACQDPASRPASGRAGGPGLAGLDAPEHGGDEVAEDLGAGGPRMLVA